MRRQVRNSSRFVRSIDVPMIEIFGATLALLMIIFSFIQIVVSSDIRSVLERSLDDAIYRVSWHGTQMEGLVVLSWADKLSILETNTVITADQICTSGEWLEYVGSIYGQRNKQIIFAILDGGVGTMAVARECMRRAYPNRLISIGWMVLNKETMRSLRLNELPAYLKKRETP